MDVRGASCILTQEKYKLFHVNDFETKVDNEYTRNNEHDVLDDNAPQFGEANEL